MAAIKGIYHAVINENATVLIISPTERQSQNVFRKMKNFINKATIEGKGMENWIVRRTQHIIEWENGSVIHALPVTEEGSNIVGFTAHFIIIDEAARIKDEAFSSINPMLAATNGYMWMISTFKGVNNMFYRTWLDPEKKGFNTYTFPSSKSPLIVDRFLEEEKHRLSTLEYEQEYNAKAIDEADTYFTIQEIESCQKDYPAAPLNPGCDYYLGFDPARMGEDEGCAVIAEKRRVKQIKHPSGVRHVSLYKIYRIYEMKHQTINQQIGFVKNLHRLWNFKKIVVDDTGLGAGVSDDLMKDQYPVDGVVFSIKSKEELYSHTKIEMQNDNVILPKSKQTDLDGEKLKKQLNEIKYEYQKGSGYIKLFPATKHTRDDYVSGMVLALWGARGRPSPIVFGTTPSTF